MSRETSAPAQGIDSGHERRRVNTYRCLPLRPLPDVAGYSSILQLWDLKRGDRLMPKRADFTFEDFLGWHGAIAISVVEGDDLRFTLYGNRYVELLGVDLTNKLLCASMDENLIARTKSYFADLIHGPHIGQVSGGAPTEGRDFIAFDVLDMPLSENGQDVTQFVHALSTAASTPPALADS